MTKKSEHDATDPLDSALAGMLTEAMSNRHHQLRTSQGSLTDVHMRARRITRRRTAVGAGALVAVGAVGVVAVARNGDGGDGQRLAVGSNGQVNDAAGPGGADGGHWECTGPLGSTAMDGDLRQQIDVAGGVATMLPVPGPTTTLVVVDTTSTVPISAATTLPPATTLPALTTTVPFDPTTTFPFDPTSTTVDLSASTSTVDPGLATATSYLATPIPVPIDNGGVFYMQDCNHVDGAVPYDTLASADTYPAGLDPDAPTIVVADTELAGTGTGVADPPTSPSTVTATDAEAPPTSGG